MTGTLMNAFAVLVGASMGTLIGERLPGRFRQTVMATVGLMTLLIGFQMALGITRIRVANMLPALAIAPFLTILSGQV
jgi:uncharacterized protein